MLHLPQQKGITAPPTWSLHVEGTAGISVVGTVFRRAALAHLILDFSLDFKKKCVGEGSWWQKYLPCYILITWDLEDVKQINVSVWEQIEVVMHLFVGRE